MKSHHHIVYIPGLGDHYDKARLFMLWFWRVWGIKTQLVPMQWYGKGGYEQKVTQIKTAIKAAQDAGYAVSLIGESAGASMALNVSALVSDLHCVITLAGVNSSKLPISPITRRRSPAFAMSAASIDDSLLQIDTSRIHTIRAVFDPVVSPRYDTISGAHHHRIFCIGHIPTILLCLTLLSPYLISIIKRTPRPWLKNA